jgi:endonuclease YncB( thermonuclease family)
MQFKVVEVIDGGTFKVSPSWQLSTYKGDTVTASGYNPPSDNEPGFALMKKKLEDLVLNKKVELKEPMRITNGRLICKVFFQDKDMADSFKEYK